MDVDAIVAATHGDKKARGGQVEYALPVRVGAMADAGGRWSLPVRRRRRARGAGVIHARAVVTSCAFAALACSRDHAPFRYPPVVVMSEFRLPGALVEGASRGWWKVATQPRFGDPLPVGVTMYCLNGTTRRGRYVREGIVAADPKLFPLAHFIELYVGRTYLGHFLVDDTGRRIRGPRIDVWTSNCREARRFGIARGTAVLIGRTRRDTTEASGARASQVNCGAWFACWGWRLQRQGGSMSSFATYLIGFVILIAGLGIAAYLAQRSDDVDWRRRHRVDRNWRAERNQSDQDARSGRGIVASAEQSYRLILPISERVVSRWRVRDETATKRARQRDLIEKRGESVTVTDSPLSCYERRSNLQMSVISTR